MNDDLIHVLTFFPLPFSHQNLQHGLQNIAGCRTEIYLQADRIKQQAGTAAEAILMEKLQPFQRATYLEKMLQRKLDELQVVFFFLILN